MSLSYKWRVVTGRAGFSLWNTLKVNFSVFPFAVARKLPIKAGRHLDTKGLGKGAIRFRNGVTIHKYMLRLGVTPWPLYSNKAMHTWLWFHAGASLVVGDETDINSGCRFVLTAGATVETGDHFFINQNSLVYCSRSIRFGHHCTLGWDCQVYDSDFHLCLDGVRGVVKNPVREVLVGDNVWVANRCTIGKGSVVPSNAVVASGSLVNDDLAAQLAAALAEVETDDRKEIVENLEGKGALFAGRPAQLKRLGVRYITDKRQESRLRRQFAREGKEEIVVNKV